VAVHRGPRWVPARPRSHPVAGVRSGKVLGGRLTDVAHIDPTRAEIAHAIRVFGLAPIERDLFVHLLELAVGLRGAGGARTIGVAELIDAAADRSEFAIAVDALDDAAALRRHALVTLRGDGPLLARTISLDDEVWPRLIGSWPSRVPRPDDARAPGFDELALAPAAAARAAAARAWLRAHPAGWPTVVVQGPPGAGRGAVARALAGELGLPVIVIAGDDLTAARLPVFRRELAWFQATALVVDAERGEPAALTALAADPGALLATSAIALVERLMVPDRVVHVVVLDRLDDSARAAIWRRCLERAGVRGDVDGQYLAAHFGFSPQRIDRAARALAAGGTEVSSADAEALCRVIPEVRVGGLAARLETNYGWDDLVVTAAVRRELELIVTWGRSSARLFASGADGERARAPRGLACLFHGPPGTGKTLAAQVIAAELGLELYRVDLSQVVDKYIGETEKRLDVVFREAEAAGVALFFDEADALFARRTEVKEARDRYANLEASFLLQRIEEHRGVTILASNAYQNLDVALHRRLGVSVELTAPGPVERRAIWERLLPPRERRASSIDVDMLARVGDLTGGDIRNAVVAAVLIAAGDREPLDMRHLVVAIWRQLTKAGRIADGAELGPWQSTIRAYAAVSRRPA
jgi:AAA+ superfamily predicted ATPase